MILFFLVLIILVYSINILKIFQDIVSNALVLFLNKSDFLSHFLVFPQSTQKLFSILAQEKKIALKSYCLPPY